MSLEDLNSTLIATCLSFLWHFKTPTEAPLERFVVNEHARRPRSRTTLFVSPWSATAAARCSKAVADAPRHGKRTLTLWQSPAVDSRPEGTSHGSFLSVSQANDGSFAAAASSDAPTSAVCEPSSPSADTACGGKEHNSISPLYDPVYSVAFTLHVGEGIVCIGLWREKQLAGKGRQKSPRTNNR